jgi:hypothetical protein
MSGPFTAPPHRAKGSWTPRLAGVAVVVVVAGGALAIYLGAAQGHQPIKAKHHRSSLSVKVVSGQTVGLIDFGPYDDGDAWQGDSDDHPLMLSEKNSVVDFVRIPRSEINSSTPEWTADQMSSGGVVFIYVPANQCLTAVLPGQGNAPGTSATGGDSVKLTRCGNGPAQRWRPVHARVVLGEAVAQYANVAAGGCLTARRSPGPAMLTPCARIGTKHAKNQEIAFWWSA